MAFSVPLFLPLYSNNSKTSWRGWIPSLCSHSLLISPEQQLKLLEKPTHRAQVCYQTMSNCDVLLRTRKMDEPILEEWNLLFVLKGMRDQMFEGWKNSSPWVLQISWLSKTHFSKMPHDSKSKENLHRRIWPEGLNSVTVFWFWDFSWIRQVKTPK